VRRVPIPPCPTSLLPEGSKGAQERAAAIAHFTAENRAPGKPFKFRAYRDEKVIPALLEAFNYVCAYCESRTATVEVEHFRPKNEVRTAAGTLPTGYYWLAATWENLLPSCHECNQRLGTHAPGTEPSTSGKGTWFPLEDEAARATREGEEARERPLLLHPYFDEPAAHLEFLDCGIVRAREDANGKPSHRGEETIRILGLNRYGLPENRKVQFNRVQDALEDLLDAQCEWQKNQDEASAEAHRQCLEILEQFLKHPENHFAVTGQILGLTGPQAQ
jgi:uncharacterized protein (TIGR02646 family)